MTKTETVKEYIKRNITNKIWEERDKIYSESELMKELSVSRCTVRNAIKDLVNENILETVNGLGSFVKVKNINKPYIIIVVNEVAIIGNSKITFKYISEKLKTIIAEKQFIPIYYVDSKKKNIIEELGDKINKIAGAISVHATDISLTRLLNHNIPVVSSTVIFSREYPSVIINYGVFSNIILKLLNKYNLKNVLIFSIKNTIRKIQEETIVAYGFDKIFDKYNNIKIPISINQASVPSYFRNTLNNLKYIPDAVCFQDDTIFNLCLPIFDEYKHIFKNTKIIAQTSSYKDYNTEYNICKIEFDLEKVANESINLLLNIINNKFLTKHNILINPNVINEKALE